MPVQVRMEGLSELREALRNLPEALTDEAKTIVSEAAERVAQDVRTSYPSAPTGNLQRGVTVSRSQGGRFGEARIVSSRAPHAAIYEFGTKQRQTKRGFNRGSSPKHDVLIRIAITQRNVMFRKLIALVKRAGFEVSE